MKTSLIKILSFILITVSVISGQDKLYSGADVIYSLPVGEFAKRFNPAAGGSFSFGIEKNKNWILVGRFDYTKFDEVNSDDLKKQVKSDTTGSEVTYDLILNDVKMTFETAFIGIEGRYRVVETGFVEANLLAGFGFSYWEFERAEYRDSLYAYIPEFDEEIFMDEINVPFNKQIDWSGTIIAGADVSLFLLDNVAVRFAADYKLIIGELWPALDLGMENVSGLQMFNLKAGVNIKF